MVATQLCRTCQLVICAVKLPVALFMRSFSQTQKNQNHVRNTIFKVLQLPEHFPSHKSAHIYTLASLTHVGQFGTWSRKVRHSQTTSKAITHSQAGQYSKMSRRGDHQASWKTYTILNQTPVCSPSKYIQHLVHIAI